ncbi:MAG: cytochrome B [Burkholderiales bacterium]|nr:cytochrome B [Burkholderiales bacterium]
MVAAWAIAAPLAVLLARYYKVTPRQRWPQELDNPFWWHAHRLLNYAALAATALGLWLVWGAAGRDGALFRAHALAGWSVAALALLQLAGAHLRGSKGGPTAPRRAADGTPIDLAGDHYCMTPRRIRFERVHKAAGYVALAAAACTIAAGLVLADAPRWMGLVIGAWWIALGAGAIRLQRAGRCLDTYQAIWGPDPAHPGNARAPVGWGIRRAAPAPAPRR